MWYCRRGEKKFFWHLQKKKFSFFLGGDRLVALKTLALPVCQGCRGDGNTSSFGGGGGEFLEFIKKSRRLHGDD